jgi:hypothetical protein
MHYQPGTTLHVILLSGNNFTVQYDLENNSELLTVVR